LKACLRSKKNRLIEILRSGGVIHCFEGTEETDTSQTQDNLCPDLAYRHPPQKQPITYQQLLQAYFRERLLRSDSQTSYQNAFNALLRGIKDSTPDQLSREQLLNWRKNRLAQGLSSTSWNTYLRHLRAVFRLGLAKKLLLRSDNPFNDLFLPAAKRKKKTVPTDKMAIVIKAFDHLHHLEQAGKLRGERAGRICPPWFWRTVFETLYHTGIRSNQLLHLRLQDIDLQSNLLHIREAGSKTHREYEVPISEALKPWLEQLIQKASRQGMQPAERLFNVTRFKSGYKKHKQMIRDHLSRAFTDLSERLGFRVSPHRFRHTLGTSLMRNAGANVHLVKDLLGHTNLSTTLQYIEPDMDGLRNLLDSRAAKERPDSKPKPQK